MRLFRPMQPPKIQHELVDSSYQYQEYQPSKNLESNVACYWTVNTYDSDAKKLHRIIPDGCVDIIFDLQSASISKGAFVAGLMTSFMVTDLARNSSSFGIRFYVDTVHHFLRYPVSAFIGKRVFLEDIWGPEGLFLLEDLKSTTQISDIIEKVESRLMSFLPVDEPKVNDLVQTSMQYIFAHQGIMSIRSLSNELHYSERHIRRCFQNELGVSPKELINIIRFQSLLHELYKDPQPRFTDIAVKYGYYDQAHFIKNFKQKYGLSPTEIF